MGTDVVQLGSILHTHGTPEQKRRHSLQTKEADSCRGGASSLPGSVRQLEDDVIGQVVHLPQPELIGDVVTVHERLQEHGFPISIHNTTYTFQFSEVERNMKANVRLL